MVGEIILALRKLDLLQKTIVIYTSDHGEMAMEHRQFYKMSMYEASAHVPLLMMGPGIKVNLQVPNFVSLVDIYPTMLGEYCLWKYLFVMLGKKKKNKPSTRNSTNLSDSHSESGLYSEKQG